MFLFTASSLIRPRTFIEFGGELVECLDLAQFLVGRHFFIFLFIIIFYGLALFLGKGVVHYRRPVGRRRYSPFQNKYRLDRVWLGFFAAVSSERGPHSTFLFFQKRDKRERERHCSHSQFVPSAHKRWHSDPFNLIRAIYLNASRTSRKGERHP